MALPGQPPFFVCLRLQESLQISFILDSLAFRSYRLLHCRAGSAGLHQHVSAALQSVDALCREPAQEDLQLPKRAAVLDAVQLLCTEACTCLS